MNITKTNISDITNDIDNNKLLLADQILGRVKPLFVHVENEKHKILKMEESKFSLVKKEILKNKEKLEQMVNNYKKEKLIKQILNQVSTIVSSGLVYESNLKKEIIILLKVLFKLPLDKLKQQLIRITNILSKRF